MLVSRLRTVAAVLEAVFLLSRVQLLLATNVLLQIADGFVTFLGLRLGMAEGNPLLVFLMDAIGTEPALVLGKLGALAGLAVLYRCRRHPLVEPGLASLAVVYTVMAIVPWTVILATTL